MVVDVRLVARRREVIKDEFALPAEDPLPVRGGSGRQSVTEAQKGPSERDLREDRRVDPLRLLVVHVESTLAEHVPFGPVHRPFGAGQVRTVPRPHVFARHRPDDVGDPSVEKAAGRTVQRAVQCRIRRFHLKADERIAPPEAQGLGILPAPCVGWRGFGRGA